MKTASQISMISAIFKNFTEEKEPRKGSRKRKTNRTLRIEELESREMLSVNMMDFALLPDQHDDLDVSNFVDCDVVIPPKPGIANVPALAPFAAAPATANAPTIDSLSQDNFDAIREKFAKLGLSEDVTDYHVFEVGVYELSDETFRAVLAEAADAPKSLVVVYTTALTEQNTITLTDGELKIDSGNITVIALGEENLTIDANQESRVFNIGENATVGLAGLTITNGQTATYGGGIYNTGTLTLTECTITENSVFNAHGGGIYNDSGTLTLTQCTITENSADSGGGIYNINGTLTFTECTITENSARGGGGIFNDSGTLTLTGCTIAENAAWWFGGGILNDFGTLTLTECTITENSASTNNGSGGGIYNSNGTLMFTECTITKNSASTNNGSGGGIYNSNGTLMLMECAIAENTARNSGGIYNDSGTLTLTECTVAENTARISGGIYNDSGELTLTKCTIAKNAANDYGGGIRNNSGTLTLMECTIAKNSTFFDGGGIYNDSGTLTLMECTLAENLGRNGGGIYNYSGTLTLAKCTITDNSADSGGGIYNDSGTLTLTECTITKNSVASYGGGIRNNSGTLTLTECTIMENSTDNNYGGGIYNGSGTLTLAKCTVAQNTTNQLGGGISNSGTLTLTECTVAHNSAKNNRYYHSGGGGIHNSGTLILTDTVVAKNLSKGKKTSRDIDNDRDGTVTGSTVPTKAGIVRKSNITLSKVTLSWKHDATKNMHYVVRCVSDINAVVGTINIVPRPTVTITGLKPGTTHNFFIICYQGDVAVKAIYVSVKTKAYAAPTGVTKTATSSTVTLYWKASPFTETNRYEVICYDSKGQSVVYRADDPNIVMSRTFATISYLKANTKYKFEIRAISDLLGGLESKAKTLSVTTKKL